MYFGKKIKFVSLCLALISCLCALPLGTAFADGCAEHSYTENVLVPATVTENGSVEYVCSVCGETVTEVIPQIASVTLRANSVSFKDKAQVPEIIITDINGNPIEKENYIRSITTAGGKSVPYGKAIGKYVITLTFCGKYAGEETLSFRIVPTAVENLSLSSSSSKVTLTFDAHPDAKGYQIYYSKHKNGPFKRLITTSKTTYTSKTLSADTTYYFKVRAYRKTDGVTIPGKFSAVQSITVNK